MQAGVFVPAQDRVVDTRTGLGGISGALTPNTWYPFQILGQGGVPTTNVDSVLVTLTVVNSTGASAAQVVPKTGRQRETTVCTPGPVTRFPTPPSLRWARTGSLPCFPPRRSSSWLMCRAISPQGTHRLPGVRVRALFTRHRYPQRYGLPGRSPDRHRDKEPGVERLGKNPTGRIALVGARCFLLLSLKPRHGN